MAAAFFILFNNDRALASDDELIQKPTKRSFALEPHIQVRVFTTLLILTSLAYLILLTNSNTNYSLIPCSFILRNITEHNDIYNSKITRGLKYSEKTTKFDEKILPTRAKVWKNKHRNSNIVRTWEKSSKNSGKIISPGERIWNEIHTGYLSEEEAMSDKPCENLHKSTSPTNTKVIIQDNKRSFLLNARIRLMITTYDYYNKPRTEGGDIFVATMKTQSKNASAPGIVTDLHNGSYKVEFNALWTGKAVISVTLAYTKQTIASYFRARRKHSPTEYLVAIYENEQNVSESVYCHPNYTMMSYNEICMKDSVVGSVVCNDEGLTPERKEICNFTTTNSGSPFYCFKPLKSGLMCKDWKYVKGNSLDDFLILTDCEINHTNRKLSTTINIFVRRQSKIDTRTMIDLPNKPCSKYNRTSLWLRREPTGFYYKGIWHLRHCKAPLNIISCMENKNFYLIGDSTMRQWYVALRERYNCEQITEKWTEPKWLKKTICVNWEHNFTVTFGFHNLPVILSPIREKEVFLNSVGRYMDNITDDEHAVVIFNLFSHMNRHHPELTRLKMKQIYTSAKQLLNRNKKVKIMIKAPHYYYGTGSILGYNTERIIFEIFYDIFEKVMFLNNRDSSIAANSGNIHPEAKVVFPMIDQALTYACD